MYRIGQSTDIHNLSKGKQLILGQINIPSIWKVEAISDGDVITHAICEAIIGALGLGDLGEHFPENKQKKGFASSQIIEHCNKILLENKYQIVNIDSLIILDKPNLLEHKMNIKNNLAKLFDIEIERINVKATTSEHNFLSMIQASAVVLLKKVE
ncbi:2-C-methyl-D-erythritol 2,4-cyclodiphosphate synthase [Spiroplasma endosymbiont of Panorpa germanica]|uniref:2-C-methyl-D-erythritol 2,4-cyclodiphosphate synthase n=1 Tax=Spiroplasma endosymbiont of Panorpa germanica TaxID=3066314 RepID=UPI0030CD9067